MSEKLLYIYGAGGLGREVLSLINNIGTWTPAGFVDDNVAKGSKVGGLSVLGGREILRTMSAAANLVLAIGDPRQKARIVQDISRYGFSFPVLIHPAAILQARENIAIGEGSIIGAGSVLTTDISVGRHVLINLNTTIGHDTRIGDYSSVMPGVNIAGEVAIGEAVLIGSGANIMNRMTIGDGSRVGMGAVVTRPVASGTTVVGIPARPRVK